MPPVVARTLRRCLALIALAVSAWGALRTVVEQHDERTERETIVADASSLAQRSATAMASPMRVALAPVVVPCVDRRQFTVPALALATPAAPTMRRGSAGGPRAP